MLDRELSSARARLGTQFWRFDLLAPLLATLLVLAASGRAGADTWDETIAKAKKEGQVMVVMGGGASRNLRPVMEYFENKFGIRTVLSTGSGRKSVDRVLAERGGRQYLVDVMMVGPTSANTRLIPNGALDPIGPELILPEVVNKTLWYKGKHYYSDPDQMYVFASAANAELLPFSVRFNTDKLPIEKAKRIQSVWEFLDKRFAGQIVAIPPTSAGAGGTYFTVQVHPDLGEKFLRRMFDPELDVQFSTDFRQISDGVARGKYTIAMFVGSAGNDIDRLGELGLPVANLGELINNPLKERPTLQGTGSSHNIMLVNRRPHPYAARLLINWYLSKEGQSVRHKISARSAAQTFRVDVTEQGKVLKAEMRRPGIEYLTFAHDPEIQKKRRAMLERAEELYSEIRSK